ncbi:hypothetical protein V8G54_000351 [Vigna mungo]|uniref:Uncharacterized protein n=1 Tax=Vigna mungo TaxID=3915 RepID=A0AAQ3P6R6_VIGMU
MSTPLTTSYMTSNDIVCLEGKSTDDRIPNVAWVDKKTYDGPQCRGRRGGGARLVMRGMQVAENHKAAIDIGDCCSNSINLFLPSKSEKVMLSMLEQLHAEPMKVHSNNNYRESQWHQEAVEPGSFICSSACGVGFLLLVDYCLRKTDTAASTLSGLSFPIPREGTLCSRGAVVLFVLHAVAVAAVCDVVVVQSSAWWRVVVLFSGHQIFAGTMVLFFLSEVCALLFVLALLFVYVFFTTIFRKQLIS